MKIQRMFQKDIDRPITGVVKVGQIEDKDKKQELEEYVVTRELMKHFGVFFDNYTKSIKNPTDDMGVWISGFFGSGKSHFLKILSYDLDHAVIAGKHAWEYLKENNQSLQTAPMLLANMELAAQTPTEVILFNVDSKSAASAKSDSNAIVMVFNRVFNEKLGYIGSIPALADLERELDEEGRYQEFQDAFLKVTGKEWMETRHKFKIMRGKVEKTLVEMGYMSTEDASFWAKETSTQGYQIAIEDFAERVRSYVERSGKRVVFFVDEIGQFISTDSHLMLNLQTITEELGVRCKGKVWVIVTAQEDIDSMTENMQERSNDFSKIQGRFKTRLSLSSVNADEVIRERILKKNETGQSTLKVLYETQETTIQNVIDFKGTAIEMKKIKNAEEFASVYPFLPYQFNLLGDVLNAIRLNSSTGKHLSEGERSMLGAYQRAAICVMEKEEGVLVPFYRFYDDLIKFLDHTHAGVIQRADDNDRLNPLHNEDCFTINVLKTLFLLKYVNGVDLTVGNIVSLMITNIHDDRTKLRRAVEESLQLLTRNLLVSQLQDTYEFLTDEEQDINRAIRDRSISGNDVIRAAARAVFDSIYNNTRYRVPIFNGRYTYAFNQTVDTVPFKNNQSNEIGLRLITPKYICAEGGLDDTALSMMSARNQEIILKLPADNIDYYNELLNSLKIDDYIRNVADPQKGKSTAIRAAKMQESTKSKDAAVKSLKEAIGSAEVFINGQKITDISVHEATTKIGAALAKLVDNIYYKLSYIDSPKDDMDIKSLFAKNHQITLSLDGSKEPNANAVREVKEYIGLTSSAHTSISMKSLVDRFTIAPFGYVEADIKWLVARAFKDGAVSATIDKEPITLFNRKSEDLGTYFTTRKYDEKLLFRAKETIDAVKVKACRDVMKAFFNRTETDSDADKIMASFKDHAKDTIKDCNDMLKVYMLVKGYPGNDTLQKAVKMLTEISAIEDAAIFYNKIAEEKGAFIDLADDLAPVKTFYTSSTQQKIFRENGLLAIHFFDNSKEHISSDELNTVMGDIKKIVYHKAPYNMIKNLPSLHQSFMDTYGKVLDEKLAPVLEVIEQDKTNVLNYIKDQFYEEEYKAAVIKAFAELSDRASTENDISNMLGFKDKADSLCKTYLDKFSNMAAPVSSDPQPAGQNDQTPADSPKVTPKRIKNLMARDITSDIWVITSEKDLNVYLAKVKKQIKDELDKNDIVKLQF